MGRLDPLLPQQAGDELRMRFVGVLHEETGELLFAQPRNQARCGLSARRVHPHVQRTGILVAETPVGVVELHGGDAEVHENDVGGSQAFGGEHLRQAREVGLVGAERLRAEARRAEMGFRPRQLERIHVESDQTSAWLDALENRPGMPAAAERAVNRDIARFRPETQQDLFDHDRPMRTGGRLAGGEDLLHGRGIPRWVELLVLLVECARVLARVPRASAVNRRVVS
jgi:hypothetical protein